ncbi:MAG: hypothetical protein H0T75_15280 [Rhizobiales bacterium]|nr:hypothetical protein [Hyphomicrobiales bacterium]
MLRQIRESSGSIVFAGLIISALALRLLGAYLFPSIHHPDEIFQTLEPAHRLWTGWGVVSWEWRDGIRSWLFPGFLFLMMHAELIIPSWDAVLLGIAGVLSILSLSVVVIGFLLGFHYRGLAGGILAGVACAVWPDLVYFAPKTLTEVVAAHVMLVAAYLAHIAVQRPELASSRYFGLVGLVVGTAFCFRFHVSLALLAIAVWACRTDWRSRWVPLVLGAAVPVALLALLDFITWGSPFQSVWKNIWVNLVEGRSHIYGTSPWRRGIGIWKRRSSVGAWR